VKKRVRSRLNLVLARLKELDDDDAFVLYLPVSSLAKKRKKKSFNHAFELMSRNELFFSPPQQLKERSPGLMELVEAR